MRAATITFTILAVLMFMGKAGADEETDARVRKAFTKAWAAKHDTKTDRDEIAVELYRNAWLGFSFASVRFADAMASKNKPYPDDATAESIIRGEHGDASTWRLWELTNDICLDYFTERPKAIIKAMTKDLQGDLKDRRRVSNILSEWQRYILFHQKKPFKTGSYDMQDSAYKETWELIVRELYPAATKAFQELKDPDPYANEPLAYLLRDLEDPRAIPVLLGKDGRDIQYFEMFLHLQHNHKADPGLVKLTSDPDAEVRWRAVYALRECADQDMAPKAMQLLRDESPKVRSQALYLAFFLLSPERPDLDAQFKILLDDPDVEVRLECVILLAQRKDVACATAMLDLLRNEKLGEIPHNRLVQSMRDLTGDYFGYHIGSDAWQPTTPNNRAALEKFAKWIEEHKTKR
jgi:hypothetical protein